MNANGNLPPLLMTSEAGSFARATIVERKPQIIQQVLAAHREPRGKPYPPEIVAALESFQAEIASQPVQPLQELAPDVSFWNSHLSGYAQCSWLEVPWYFAETFFYRKLLEAVRYFQPGEWQFVDPFEASKKQQIETDAARAAAWDDLTHLDQRTAFEALLHACLWGNRTDLSNFTVKVKGQSGASARDERHHILIDHTEPIYTLLRPGLKQLDFINDNVGADLIADLALADFLLHHGWVEHVVFHLKPQPFFVSDALPKDVLATVEALRRSAPAWGERLRAFLAEGRLRLETDPFWATCLFFSQMPTALRERLAGANIVLIKGDVNYRRLLEDRHWPPTTRMETITRYFPTTFAVLRTLKGEIIVGLQPGQAEEIAAADPTWLINGKRGLIQLVER